MQVKIGVCNRLKIDTIEGFLKDFTTARVQLGWKCLGYIGSEDMYIIYDVRMPHEIQVKTKSFGLAMEELER